MDAHSNSISSEPMEMDEHEHTQTNSGAKNDHLHSELNRIADEMRTESTTKEALSHELEQSRKTSGQLQTELKRVYDEVNAKSIAIIELKTELGQLRTTAEHLSQTSTTDDASERSAEIERLTQELEQTRAKNDHLQSELHRIADEMRTESTKKQALSHELEESRKTAGQLQTELNRVDDEVNAKSIVIVELKTELGQLRTTAEYLSQTSAIDDASEKSAEIERLTQELDQTRAKHDHLQSELYRIADEMRTEFTKKEAFSHELEQSRKTAGQLQTELNRVNDEVSAKSVEIVKLKKELGQLSETSAHDLAEATAKIIRQAEEIIQLQNESDNFKQINNVFQMDLQKCYKEITSKEEKLKESEREIANYKSTLETYRTEVHSQTETIRLIQDENIVLSRSLTRMHKEVARLNTDKAELLSKNDAFQSQLQFKEDELSKEKRKHNTNKPEINSLKKEIHAHKETLDKERKQWNAEKAKLEKMCNVAKEETNRFRHAYETVTQECNAVKETLKKTSEERDELTMRLSKLASASLTHNNPNIADLSDPNRPTKLAEIFSELYDNEWTDAFEKLKEDDERTTVDRLLTMLQKSYGFSVALTDQASNDIGGKCTSLSLKYNKGPNVQALQKSASRHAGERHEETTELRDPPETRIEDKSATHSYPEYSENVKSDVDTIGEKERSASLTAGCSELKSILKVDQQHQEMTAEHGLIVGRSNTYMSDPISICAQDDQMHAKDTMPLCKDIAMQVGSPEEMDVSTLSLDVDILSPTEKQAINDIRKRVLHELKGQIIPVIANAVVGEMNLHACDGSIITYVKACASVCWEMRIHQPPVCLEFLEVDDKKQFNTATYKHYTKNGLGMDYVVWPAMYLCKGGPLLNKGVAQGR